MRPFLLAAGSALLLGLAHAPFGLWPLAYVALVPLCGIAGRGALTPRRLWAAYLGGVTWFAAGCSWLAETSPANLVVVALVEGLTWPAFLVLRRGLDTGFSALPGALRTSIAWCAVEAARSHAPWNGFPWFPLGAALTADLPSIQGAAWFGTSGLSFLVAAVNGHLAAGATGRARVRRVAAAVIVPLAVHVAGLPAQSAADEALVPGPRVLVVQANVPQSLKRHLAWRDVEAMQVAATRRAVADADGADLVVWAETMWVRGFPDEGVEGRDGDDARLLSPFLERDLFGGAAFLTGSLLYGTTPPDTGGAPAPSRRVRNGVVLFDAEGRRRGTYAKTLLVPGGEFLPLRDLLPGFVLRLIEKLAALLPDLQPGDGPRLFELACADGRTFRLAPTVCYENAYSGYHALVGRLDPDFLVNLSNEGWFGESAEFDQMDALSRLRAVETRKSLLRATNTGISALYLPSGRRVRRIHDARGRDRAVAGFLSVEVPVARGRSWFTRTGDWVGVLTQILAAAGAALALLRSRRRYPRRPNG